jgi:hypothetical protein
VNAPAEKDWLQVFKDTVPADLRARSLVATDKSKKGRFLFHFKTITAGWIE